MSSDSSIELADSNSEPEERPNEDSSDSYSMMNEHENAVMEQNAIVKTQSPKVSRRSQGALMNDIHRPIGDAIVQCCIRRDVRGPLRKSVYQLFCEDSIPVLIARSSSSICSTQYQIIEPTSGERIGEIKSDFRALRFTVRSNRQEFEVEYQSNVGGRNGARVFRVRGIDNRVFCSKPPVVINGSYFLDLHSSDAQPSARNFVLVPESDYSKEIVLLIKNTDFLFDLRLTGPFSLFSAFALALTSLHTGFWHR